MLREVENFNTLENVENKICQERPTVSEQAAETVTSYFSQLQTRSMSRAVTE